MKINKYIDYTNLAPEATADDIKRLVKEAIANKFYAVCVNPNYVSLAVKQAAGKVKVAAVCGFPLGQNHTFIKAHEAALAVDNGASEIDMVLNIGALVSGDFSLVSEDIATVVKAAKVPVKVIIETSKLNDEQKVLAVKLAVEAGAAFVKTSTGFGGGGATEKDISLMKAATEGFAKVKASGGIRSYEQAVALIKAGADRIGTSRLLTPNKEA